MIVGSGLIASAFKESDFHSLHHVIFASGVSNSNETDSKPYLREMELIARYLDKSTTFIYFSTTSVFDPTRQESIYIRHKVKVEEFLRQNASSYLIVRLPIMIGHSSNPHTLINFLVNAIKTKTLVHLQSKACRNLLDIDDLLPLLKPFLNADPVKSEVNILGSRSITVPNLVKAIEENLQLTGNYIWENTGACFEVPPGKGNVIYKEDDNYIQNILKKYLANDKLPNPPR